MNQKTIKSLKLKAKRYIEEITKDDAMTYEEFNQAVKRAYRELKKMYQESTKKQREELGL